MRDDKLTELIFSQQLVSVMSCAKWRKVAQALTSHPAFTPTVRLRYLDGYAPTGFTHLDWEWVRQGDTRVIRWMDINPICRERVGQPTAGQQADFSNWVREMLLKQSIPFTEDSGLFRIDAYLQPAAS